MKKENRKLTVIELEVFNFLNDFRDSGAANIFEAPHHIVERFELSKEEARKVFKLWTLNFDSKGNYEKLKKIVIER